ncbi:MAG: HAMP domain-containing sensor histidine kinase [Proteobacteria bacterium]|nr:HAMP domain-containing sensor histidine kinase [Pseudomonadota bacterium]
MNHYPRSFLGLIVLGNILVVLPLLVAIGYASVTIDDITQRSQRAVPQASRAGMLSHELQEHFDNMGRILQQYEVQRDPALLEEYRALRRDWERDSEEYMSIPLLADLSARIGEIRKREAAAYANLATHLEGVAEMKTVIAGLGHGLRPLLEDAERLVQRERETFRLQAREMWRSLTAALLVALAFSALSLWFGRRTWSQLWRRFERAIYALGEGRLNRPVILKGPDDMQRVGQRLEWLRRRMQTLENERTRVLRHVSHELKTPLASLREGASLLTEGVAGPLTPQQEKIVGIMQTNVLRLQGLIQGVLRMQQANYARERMETSAIRLDQVIEQTLATFQPAARDRQVRIAASLAPLTVNGSSDALETLANNLISNAIKFSPDGGVVRVTLFPEGDNALLDVIDEGPGISDKDRERLFEPFYRGSAGKDIPGIGLGLAISHEYALAHKGSLDILVSEGGAHFRASLPLANRTGSGSDTGKLPP